jgi:hypothetical protein
MDFSASMKAKAKSKSFRSNEKRNLSWSTGFRQVKMMIISAGPSAFARAFHADKGRLRDLARQSATDGPGRSKSDSFAYAF